MVRFLLACALLLFAAVPGRAADPVSISEVMRATSLDSIFQQFGPTIAAAARTEYISPNRVFLERWEDTARRTYDAAALTERLAASLERVLSIDDRQALGTFFRSDLGRKISSLERSVANLDPPAQTEAAEQGRRFVASANDPRRMWLERMNTPEMAKAFVRQGLRAMLVGLSVAGQRGTIVLPWAAIDSQVEAMMPALTQTALDNQRAMMAFAYRDLSDAELGSYADFLATSAATRLNQVASEAADLIVTEATRSFGQTLAARMSGVGV
jgi:hypothetical protein